MAAERLDEMQDPKLTISQAVNPETFEDSKKIAQQGGNVAKVALKELETKTGKKVVSAISAKALMNEKETTKKIKSTKA